MIDFAYRIRWMPRAIRDMKRLPDRDRRKVIEAVERFARTNEGDVKKLTGVHPPEERLRVGAYRVRFSLNKAERIMTVLRVLPRDKAYLRVLPRDKAYQVREPGVEFSSEMKLEISIA